MKDQHDTKTQDLIPQPRRRGRPATGEAKSGAARQAAYLARKKENNVTLTVNRDDLATLKLLLANAPAALALDAESLERLTAVVFDSALAQRIR